MVISNHRPNSFPVLFDKIAFVYFICKIYLYFSFGNGHGAHARNQHCANCFGALSFPTAAFSMAVYIFKDIHLLEAFSSAVLRTVVQQLTSFHLRASRGLRLVVQHSNCRRRWTLQFECRVQRSRRIMLGRFQFHYDVTGLRVRAVPCAALRYGASWSDVNEAACRERKCADTIGTAGSLGWPFSILKYKYFFK